MVADKHKNFMEIVNSVLAKNYTLDELLKNINADMLITKSSRQQQYYIVQKYSQILLESLKTTKTNLKQILLKKLEGMTHVLAVVVKNTKNAAGQIYNPIQQIMIKQLKLKDYILIDELCANFDDKLNIITGETGAGKVFF